MNSIYSAEQIQVPPELPDILKNYAKFIIRSAPPNILQASVEYFQGLASQELKTNNSSIQHEQLKLFFSAFSINFQTVTRKEILRACELAGVSSIQIQDTFGYNLLSSMGAWPYDQIPWISFWSILLASVAGNLLDTILLALELGTIESHCDCRLLLNVFEYMAAQDPDVQPHLVAGMKNILESSQNILSSIVLRDRISAVFSNQGDSRPDQVMVSSNDAKAIHDQVMDERMEISHPQADQIETSHDVLLDDQSIVKVSSQSAIDISSLEMVEDDAIHKIQSTDNNEFESVLDNRGLEESAILVENVDQLSDDNQDADTEPVNKIANHSQDTNYAGEIKDHLMGDSSKDELESRHVDIVAQDLDEMLILKHGDDGVKVSSDLIE